MRSSCLVFLVLFSFGSKAQTIWEEDFSSYSDGTTTGTASRWTSVCGACLAGDYFEVRGGSFEARDVNAISTWETESIDISGAASVSFSLSATENGDLEGPACACGTNIDYFDVYYSVDGGAFTVIEDWNGDGDVGHTLTGDSKDGVFTDLDWGSASIVQSGIVGNSLVIRVEMWNSSGSEVMNLDDVVVAEESILPVELISFNGVQNERGALLKWQTGSELNNSGFKIYKSVEGEVYEVVGFVDGFGTTQDTKDYEFTDDRFYEPAYYRLKQIDFDGQFEWSPTIYIGRHLQLIHVYPNPVDDFFRISIKESAIHLEVYDDFGRQKVNDFLSVSEAEHEIAHLESGRYSLRISSANHSFRTNILKR